MGDYYAELAPEHFERPRLAGLADELDVVLGEDDDGARIVPPEGLVRGPWQRWAPRWGAGWFG